jgi:hypothetical protein
MDKKEEPRLYGISNSNRRPKDQWGKNQFNSSFPVALACYMRDKNIKAVYLTLNDKLEVTASELSFDEVFNTTIPNEKLCFNFESKFDDYQQFAYDDIRGIDLVVADTKGNQLHPLEIKLTVLPDSTTYKLDEEEWGSELVIRPATTIYCALGIVHSCKNDLAFIRKAVEPICSGVRDWGNEYEIMAKMPSMLDSIDNIQLNFLNLQKPVLMQPIWRTQGKTPVLAEHAFDVFVWSDFALSRLFLDTSRSQLGSNGVSRQMRSAARLARLLYSVSSSGKANIKSIYTEMAFNHQTDKEFAVSGRTTRRYMNHHRIYEPAVKSSEIKNIILNGGEKNLSPERRFDQTVYFTVAITSELEKEGVIKKGDDLV